MICEVTGPRTLENDLVVTRKFTVSTNSAATGRKLKEQIMHRKQLCKHTEMEPTISDLTEKKLFSYMYSDASVVEALKKVTIKQVFLVSLLFKKVRVRGGGRLFEKGGGALICYFDGEVGRLIKEIRYL